eukprot:CAMPEP_0201867770 /NCGR_PEP_ID=MMETSP0902-20130614/1895_1 /ASSEMBLY_ACC=CAM_ASM_000551 /TAXON_ID=420261 /ORGANISM="Thalassiosira antarctica, Strain CCMP982" /LENGTH=228 /DNA_ID=CAMNT_0048392991 /DNA_START=50 /DNA_END=736 /DNA_ORIENTATION=+
MKISAILAASAISCTSAFAPSTGLNNRASITAVSLGKEGNVEFGGNTWKPDSEKMGSTDTGDYFPEGYDANLNPDFTEGMGGSSMGGGGDRGPALPGMENLGDDAVMMGGIEENTDIPAGMEFVMSSVPDGDIAMDVAASSKGAELLLSVKPVCMGFEDYYAAFTTDSHLSFTVNPCAGRMDRRGGEATELEVRCNPQGRAGTFVGNLVINLPEDNSKICYKITATSF